MMVYGKENNTAILVKTFATLNHLHMICAFSNNPPPPPPGQSVVAQARNYRKIFYSV